MLSEGREEVPFNASEWTKGVKTCPSISSCAFLFLLSFHYGFFLYYLLAPSCPYRVQNVSFQGEAGVSEKLKLNKKSGYISYAMMPTPLQLHLPCERWHCSRHSL